jgi:hypothetical protein
LILKSQKYFLFYFDSIFYKIYNFYKNYKGKSTFLQSNLLFLISRLEDLFIKYQMIFNTYLKYIKSINNLSSIIPLGNYFKRFKRKKYLKISRDQKRNFRIIRFFLRCRYLHFPKSFFLSKSKKDQKVSLKINSNLVSTLKNLRKLKTIKVRKIRVEVKTRIKTLAQELSQKKIQLYNKIPMLTLNLYKEIYMLFVYLKLEELQYYNILLSSFKENYLDVKSIKAD